MKTSKPISANVLEIKQKTPIGANFITAIVISIIISLNWLKKFLTISTRSDIFARITPKISANKIICNIVPFASDSKIFVGIIFNNVSVTLVACVDSVTFEVILIADISKPIPGLITLAIHKATTTASAVVHR